MTAVADASGETHPALINVGQSLAKAMQPGLGPSILKPEALKAATAA